MNQIQEFEMCDVNINTDNANGIITYSTSIGVDRLKSYNKEGMNRSELIKFILKIEKENPLNLFKYLLNGQDITDFDSEGEVDKGLHEIIDYASSEFGFSLFMLSVMPLHDDRACLSTTICSIWNLNITQLKRKFYEIESTFSHKAIVYRKDEEYLSFEETYLSEDMKKFTNVFNVIMRHRVNDFTNEHVGYLEYYLDGKYHVKNFTNKHKLALLNDMYDSIYKDLPSSITDTHFIHVIKTTPYSETDYKENAQYIIPFLKYEECGNNKNSYSVLHQYVLNMPKKIDMKDAT